MLQVAAQQVVEAGDLEMVDVAITAVSEIVHASLRRDFGGRGMNLDTRF